MSVNIKVTGGLNIEWGQIDPKVTGGLNLACIVCEFLCASLKGVMGESRRAVHKVSVHASLWISGTT